MYSSQKIESITEGNTDVLVFKKKSGSFLKLYKNGTEWGNLLMSGVRKISRLVNPGRMITIIWFQNNNRYKLSGGTHDIKAVIDENNLIKEVNERNNSFTKNVNFVIPEVPKLPDLEIKNVFLGGSGGCQVYVVIRNNGPGKLELSDYSKSGVQLWMDGKAWGGFSFNSIDKQKELVNPGSEILCDWGGPYYYSLPKGKHTIKAQVDRLKQIKEENENNNELIRELECK